jgi:hypothetical protein
MNASSFRDPFKKVDITGKKGSAETKFPLICSFIQKFQTSSSWSQSMISQILVIEELA